VEIAVDILQEKARGICFEFRQR